MANFFRRGEEKKSHNKKSPKNSSRKRESDTSKYEEGPFNPMSQNDDDYCESELVKQQQLTKMGVPVPQHIYHDTVRGGPNNLYKNGSSLPDIYSSLEKPVICLDTFRKVECRGSIIILKLKLCFKPNCDNGLMEDQSEVNLCCGNPFERLGYKAYENQRILVLQTECDELKITLSEFIWPERLFRIYERQCSDTTKVCSASVLRNGHPLEVEFTHIFEVLKGVCIDDFFTKYNIDIFLGNSSILSLEPAFFVKEDSEPQDSRYVGSGADSPMRSLISDQTTDETIIAPVNL